MSTVPLTFKYFKMF